MNYINNIFLNLKTQYFEFYEWNNNDIIKQYKKLPIIKVSSKDIYNLKNNEIILNKNLFIKSIYIFSDGKDIIAIKLDKNGNNKYKSDINISDQEKILNIIKNQKKTNLNYKILKEKKIFFFNTRKELENKTNTINELNLSYKNKEYEKLKYIYFECFNKKEKNINLIIKKIKKEIIHNSNNFNKIIDIINLTKQNS